MLGRPTHLLDAFGAALGQSLTKFFETQVGRTRGTTLKVRSVSIKTCAADMPALPWRHQPIGGAIIGIHLERALLLTLLELRYGRSATPAAAARSNDSAATGKPTSTDVSATDAETVSAQPPDTSPRASAAAETSTERRLAQKLATDLAKTIAGCIVPLSTLEDTTAGGDPDSHARSPQLFMLCQIEAPTCDASAVIGFALDAVWQQRLFAHLKSTMPRRASVARHRTSFAEHLRIKLIAQLMETEVPFGDLLRLRPGHILPVRLHTAARVLASGTQVFSASIAEHNGKLCLTSFDYVE
ncbi:hypothetical protein WL88_28895 [Burkholderia diffusa]|uniref:Flagellar motor switch protein FliN-like C-terminal domain-containing protein n=1 Tax=Burkholderia diffusa TaxID=488732 RepID=A0AAW3P7T0_9BURK|nr:FliM/FliN family flagellar motor C-terminal domain-containing protein [Burkholderia diffusa]KVH43313.1 hypothetical protein WJ39_27085 [Burkholderia diffusa]KVN02967.1 hypothetical protein WJ62_11470 [Burkholderia diffusa]KWF41367.1 hypothetical protein WL85_00090 [Burkholderia diffusa]KWF44283.1 hypothetical protein WL86_08525 [Burkholderia diffusa]KWF45101.1 hypothetical protein WL88_28895 [Burkholderia diffusa]